MDITDEMVDAGARLIAQEHGSTVFDDDHVPYEFTEAEREQYRAEARAVAEFVAPLIAAQALRRAAEELRPEAERAEADGDPFQIEYAGGIRYAIGRLAACPTCSGPTRETVGMVCQTCGTDYAPDTP